MQFSILKIYVHLDPQVSFLPAAHISPPHTHTLSLLYVCVCVQHICAVSLTHYHNINHEMVVLGNVIT